ncbi:MAG: leucine-rich repeat protein [Peptococcaceae bacterium]|jgi:hypothetical protein|nr:leucine-rich repeat protein [Peptococcaceae bacterium]
MMKRFFAVIIPLCLVAVLLAPPAPRALAAPTLNDGVNGDFILEWRDKLSGMDLPGYYLVGYTGSGGDVAIPDGVYGVLSGAFPDKAAITGIYMPDSVQFLGFGLFEGFTALKSARLPREMPYIPGWVFKNCSSLTNVTMPERFTSDDYIGIAPETFRGTKIKSITIPDGAKNIGEKAFWDCPELESVTIPPSVYGITRVTNQESPEYGDTPFSKGGAATRVVIYGVPGSPAESFARDCGIGFNKPYEAPNYLDEADKFIAGLPTYKPVDSAAIKSLAARLLEAKAAQRVPHSSPPLGHITRLSNSMTKSERYEALLRGARSDPAALAFYTQSDYGFDVSNTSGLIGLILERMARKITDGLNTDYEKTLAIHYWVADNIYYDYPLKRWIEDEKNAPAPDKSALSPTGVLELGRTVCEGYSRLTVSLLRAIGIPARYVSGNGEPGHTWYEAFADNRWILADSTWDSGNTWDDGGITASGGVRQSLPYFDASVASFASNHNVGQGCVNYLAEAFGEFSDFLGIITLDDKLARIWCLPSETIDEFVVPDYVTNMGSSLLNHVTIRANIKKLVIPGNVTQITWGSYPGNSYRGAEHLALDMREVPYRVGAMWGATRLTLGTNVKTIADQAFTSNFYLSTVELPATVENLNVTAFDDSELKAVIIRNPNIAFFKTDNFSHGGGITFYAPAGSATEKGLQAHFVKFAFHGNRVLPLETAPAEWARAGVERAKSLGIVPYYLDYAPSANITRLEFCRLAVALYEKIKGPAPLPAYLSADPLGLFLLDNVDSEHANPVTFADTWDLDVYKMYALGVIGGVGKDEYGRDIFDPYGELSREQAASMLARLYAALGKPLADAAPSFTDKANISSWAAAVVGKVQAAGIMGDVGGGRFDPRGRYTREQSIITLLRIWDAVN